MIERVDLAAWQRFDAAHPAPTFFARPAWAVSVAEVYDSLTPCLLRIQTRERETVLLPAMEQRERSFPLRRFVAFPLGAYTCFLREDGSAASRETIESAMRELSRFAHSASLVPWPLGPGLSRDYAGREHRTAVVDLSGGLEAALRGVDGCYRRMAGQAERRGVECAPSSASGAADAYYELLRESAKRWNIPEPVERRKLIDALVRHGGNDVEIWFARAGDRAVAGGVVFYGSQELFFWSAAMLVEFGRLRPSNALNLALLRAGSARGVRWFNLGSSEGLPGVARFKKDLGAHEIAYREIELARPALRIARGVRGALGALTGS